MTEIDGPLVEAEIKEHNAALTRENVAIGTIICLLLIWVGLSHRLTRSLVALQLAFSRFSDFSPATMVPGCASK
jgi:hypothetical protein